MVYLSHSSSVSSVEALREENRQLREENRQLKEENRQLREERDELKQRVSTLEDNMAVINAWKSNFSQKMNELDTREENNYQCHKRHCCLAKLWCRECKYAGEERARRRKLTEEYNFLFGKG